MVKGEEIFNKTDFFWLISFFCSACDTKAGFLGLLEWFEIGLLGLVLYPLLVGGFECLKGFFFYFCLFSCLSIADLSPCSTP